MGGNRWGSGSLAFFLLAPQLAGFSLGAKADFARAAFCLDVLCLPGIDLQRQRLVPDILDLIDLVGLIDGPAHGIVSGEFRSHCAAST
ncbi:hypothetical protein U8C31_15130 [Sinorhizobium medicae]|uniref:hypothetical protein n=1 Tax=Sinorhizobium medicae TaxID=110321 RepID=UPI002AF6C2A6|nr:hypothetical protein [Sinorhizobium medicae]WQO71613.1 hypothetical protein U8C31_15130 [Sinorhizobium medicae]